MQTGKASNQAARQVNKQPSNQSVNHTPPTYQTVNNKQQTTNNKQQDDQQQTNINRTNQQPNQQTNKQQTNERSNDPQRTNEPTNQQTNKRRMNGGHSIHSTAHSLTHSLTHSFPLTLSVTHSHSQLTVSSLTAHPQPLRSVTHCTATAGRPHPTLSLSKATACFNQSVLSVLGITAD